MKTLYLIRGLPGSGKTTLARTLTQHRFEADDYRSRSGFYVYRPEETGEAHSWCQSQVRAAMWLLGYPQIAVSNTFTCQWEMEPYRQLARQYGYAIVELTVESGLTDAALAARNTHGVPAGVIARMRARWEPTVVASAEKIGPAGLAESNERDAV